MLAGVVLALTLVMVATMYRVRVARAQWAADAAARAAAAEVTAGHDDGGPAARRAAGRVAAANGATLVTIGLGDGTAAGYAGDAGSGAPWPVSPVVLIEVELDGVRASSGAARFAVPAP
jgi:Flp pilus assembly protein TadG